jgi:hypothetical protein
MMCSTHEDSILLVAEADRLHMSLVEDKTLFVGDSAVKTVKVEALRTRVK